MTRLAAVLTALALLVLGAASAQAHPDHDEGRGHDRGRSDDRGRFDDDRADHRGRSGDRHRGRGRRGGCRERRVGVVVRGNYADDRNDSEDDGTYDGDLRVDVVGSNRHARRSGVGSGTETFRLDDTRVIFVGYDGGDGFADVDDEDRVVLIGRIGVRRRACGNGGGRHDDADEARIRKVVVVDR
jgi:hypothetical protein